MPATARAPRLERDITTKILDWLKEQPGCYARKAHGSAFGSGWPDVIGCWHGRMFALEVKRPGEPHKLTANQRAALNQWERVGAIVGVVHSVDDVRGLFPSPPPPLASRESASPPPEAIPALT